jgi:phosphatidylglycerophosphatase C
MSQQIVVFDFDGTMIRQDSTLWLIKELVRENWLKVPVTFCYLVGLFFARSGKSERLQALKCKCIGSLIKGKTLDDLKTSLDRFQTRVLGAKIDKTFTRISEAAEGNHRVLVVTASPEFAIAYILKNFPVSVIGTSYIMLHETYTGELKGQPCFGDEKVNRLGDWLSQAGYRWDAFIEAWGDSPGDWPLMQKCRKRYWIANNHQKLEKLKSIDPEGEYHHV